MIRIDEGVYERIEAHKRDDETFSEAIERLLDGPSLLSLAGILSDEEAEEMRAVVEAVDSTATEDLEDLVAAFEDPDQ